MKKHIIESIKDVDLFKLKLLKWCRRFNHAIALNSNTSQNENDDYSQYDFVFAVEAMSSVSASDCSFDKLAPYFEKNEWNFGFLNYDLKNQFENLESNNSENVEFPDFHFFTPRYLFLIKGKVIEFYNVCDDHTAVLTEIEGQEINIKRTRLNFTPRFSKLEYLRAVERVKEHIHRGDVYEMNLCQEFYNDNCDIQPVDAYFFLNELSPMPFSCFVKYNDKYLISASPERFLQKRGDVIVSQPIKGTTRRGVSDDDDKQRYDFLKNDVKEKAENTMIVDLVRNDLSRTAKRGSVKVDKLFEVQKFRQVHQMISTVSSVLNKDFGFLDVIRDSFPMGSMTGAPKVSAMKLIEKYEKSKRGLFSGSVGYISPNKDVDMNVIIRSLIYDTNSKYLSLHVGGAITSRSDAEKEYQECLLKAQAIFDLFEFELEE